MAIDEPQRIIQQLTTPGKGILAADESPATIAKRFESLSIEPSKENREELRSLLFTTPGIASFFNGVILHEETLGQRNQDGILYPDLLAEQGIVPGVKVDKGLISLNAEEKITQGLDGLAERLKIYSNLGVGFLKWRAVFSISSTLPSRLAIAANAQALARYAYICQDNGLIPIVEPELLMDGAHSLERCAEATATILYAVFEELGKHQVSLRHMILKPNMILAGSEHSHRPSIREVAEITLDVLQRTVPADVPSINFLSGGQSPELATAHLNALNQLKTPNHPWLLSFSYGRALQETALKIWNGKVHNTRAAQRELYKRAKLNAAACKGLYRSTMETEQEEESEPVFV